VVENIDVHGFEHAIRAARNPMSSWSKSDSNGDMIGTADMDLLKRLTMAGVPHRTFLRMIVVWMDVTAPLYFWKEADRYTVGKTQVSTSTMHKIHAKDFSLADFSYEHLLNNLTNDDEVYWYNEEYPNTSLDVLDDLVGMLNRQRRLYLKTKDKKYWWQLIQLLPSSYNQKRTIMMSYEVCLKIIEERTGHRLDEWNDFVETLKKLPYMEQFAVCLEKS